MSYLRPAICLLIVLVLYVVAGTMEYQDQARLEEYRSAQSERN